MDQLKKLPPAARKGGFALMGTLRRAGAAVRRSLQSFANSLGRSAALLRRIRIPVIVVSLIVLSYFLGYLNGLNSPGRQFLLVDPSMPGGVASEGTVAVVDHGADSVATSPGHVFETDSPVLPEYTGSVAVLPIDGRLVSGPDWVKDPVTGDWLFSYETLMESRTSGTVRSALSGVVRSVVNDGDTWVVRVDHGDGTVISYGGLAEADVGPGLTVDRGQRIGLAVETGSGFRVSLSAMADGEPCSAMDLIH